MAAAMTAKANGQPAPTAPTASTTTPSSPAASPSPSAPAPPAGADPAAQPGAPPQTGQPSSPTTAEPAAPVTPTAKSIDEVDLDNLDATPPAAQPATSVQSPVHPSPETSTQPPSTISDPAALISRLSTALGVAPEALTSTAAGRQALNAIHYQELISAPASTDPSRPLAGGLGYTPSTAEIVDAFHAAAAQDAFEFAYESNPSDVVYHLVAPDFDPATGRYNLRPGALNFIETLPVTLDKLGTVTLSNGQRVNLDRKSVV